MISHVFWIVILLFFFIKKRKRRINRLDLLLYCEKSWKPLFFFCCPLPQNVSNILCLKYKGKFCIGFGSLSVQRQHRDVAKKSPSWPVFVIWSQFNAAVISIVTSQCHIIEHKTLFCCTEKAPCSQLLNLKFELWPTGMLQGRGKCNLALHTVLYAWQRWICKLRERGSGLRSVADWGS